MIKKVFEPVSNKPSFPDMEREVLSIWAERGIFEKSLQQREGQKEYVFYDGPPFATGLPHYGHLLAGTIKDIVPRYHTMRGHYVSRRFGWDCHGLPIEALAQEALGLAGVGAIQQAGIDVFNEKCRSMVLTYVEEWRRTVTRMGRWVDFDDDYRTMDTPYMETIWWVFRRLWDQGRIYRAHRIMPYSWKLTTPLSNFEAGSNYKDVNDPAITVRLKLTSGVEGEAYALAWTTTPWTLPGNLALCAGPDIDYVLLRDAPSGERMLMAEARISTLYKKSEDFEIVRRYKGADLEGWTYEPLFPYFAGHAGAFRILNDAFVTTGEGTGIVHIAPAFGEDDYRVCQREGIALVDYLDAECNFTAIIPEYAGQFCKDADKAITRRLKDEGKLVHQATVMHRYPFCERTDTPLIQRAIHAWYVRVEDMRDELVANNEQVHWVPDYVGEKRFANWLKDAKDWNISRNRFWGSCIPVWVSEDGADMICVSSIDELETLSGVRVDDLHKHVVDKIVIEKDGKTYRRTPEVLDCWFESGAMPYAQCHYPFENKERFETHFPADFIAEGLDQTRGWFYTLLVLSTALFKRPAYRNVVVNGLMLAEDGRKMSKRLKNYPDPVDMIDAYGADALRLYMIYSPVVRAEELRFSENGVKQSMRDILIPLWNAYSFFVTFATIDHWQPAASRPISDNVLDRWIRSSLETLLERVTDALDAYDLQRAVRPFVHFIDDLTNWYIRRSRRRFWKSQDDLDKTQAYDTLYYVLLQLTKVAAPFVPFVSDKIYMNLRTAELVESVHLCDFPLPDNDHRDPELEAQMADIMTVVRLGRQLRSDHTLKVRQPLAVMYVVSHDAQVRGHIDALQNIMLDELNVKRVEIGDRDTALASLSAKADFKKMGPKFGPQVKKVAAAIAGLSSSALEPLLVDGQSIEVDVDGLGPVTVSAGDLVIERTPLEGLVVASDGSLVVGLDTEVTPELESEGLAREFVSKVQSMRKTAEFNVTQRIRTVFLSDQVVRDAVASFADYINAETLAHATLPGDARTAGEAVEWDLNGHACGIVVTPVKD
ncbi:MAG: isoleucine--tRNA ligase [Verrucomicrobia bacterium]|nr:isoleucine--tRNA ligase [Verrucomicrobiota bacterium]